MKRSFLLRVVSPCALLTAAVGVFILVRDRVPQLESPSFLGAVAFSALGAVLALAAAHLCGADMRILLRRPTPAPRVLVREILRCARHADQHGLAALTHGPHRPRHPLLRFAMGLASQGLDSRLVRGAVMDRCLIPTREPRDHDDALADDATRPWVQVLRCELAAGAGVLLLAAGALLLVTTRTFSAAVAPELAALVLLLAGMSTLACQFARLPTGGARDGPARLLTALLVSEGAAAIARGATLIEIEAMLIGLLDQGRASPAAAARAA